MSKSCSKEVKEVEKLLQRAVKEGKFGITKADVSAIFSGKRGGVGTSSDKEEVIELSEHRAEETVRDIAETIQSATNGLEAEAESELPRGSNGEVSRSTLQAFTDSRTVDNSVTNALTQYTAGTALEVAAGNLSSVSPEVQLALIGLLEKQQDVEREKIKSDQVVRMHEISIKGKAAESITQASTYAMRTSVHNQRFVAASILATAIGTGAIGYHFTEAFHKILDSVLVVMREFGSTLKNIPTIPGEEGYLYGYIIKALNASIKLVAKGCLLNIGRLFKVIVVILQDFVKLGALTAAGAITLTTTIGLFFIAISLSRLHSSTFTIMPGYLSVGTSLQTPLANTSGQVAEIFRPPPIEQAPPTIPQTPSSTTPVQRQIGEPPLGGVPPHPVPQIGESSRSEDLGLAPNPDGKGGNKLRKKRRTRKKKTLKRKYTRKKSPKRKRKYTNKKKPKKRTNQTQ